MVILLIAIDLYSLIVLVAVVLSWLRLSPENPVVRVVSFLTEPVLEPLRKILPDLGGLDFSAMILLIGLQLIKRLLLGL
ncbi:MAG TPA: YggT family protein [Polyangiaceae bacterium]